MNYIDNESLKDIASRYEGVDFSFYINSEGCDLCFIAYDNGDKIASGVLDYDYEETECDWECVFAELNTIMNWTPRDKFQSKGIK